MSAATPQAEPPRTTEAPRTDEVLELLAVINEFDACSQDVVAYVGSPLHLRVQGLLRKHGMAYMAQT